MTTPNIPIPKGVWVDIYAESGLDVGEALTIENISGSDLRLYTGASAPLDNGDTSGYRSIPARTEESVRYRVAGCWLWCNADAVVNVYPPVPMVVGSGGDSLNRVFTDNGETGLWENAMRRVEYLVDTSGGEQVLKVTVNVNTLIKLERITGESGTTTMLAWEESQGTPAGTFTDNDAALINLPLNGMDDAPAYTFQNTVEAGQVGASFTPNVNEKRKERISVIVATASGQKETVGGGSIRERGVGPATYYLVFSGGGTAQYDLIYQELY